MIIGGGRENVCVGPGKSSIPGKRFPAAMRGYVSAMGHGRFGKELKGRRRWLPKSPIERSLPREAAQRGWKTGAHATPKCGQGGSTIAKIPIQQAGTQGGGVQTSEGYLIRNKSRE